jgi:hypothetical protein
VGPSIDISGLFSNGGLTSIAMQPQWPLALMCGKTAVRAITTLLLHGGRVEQLNDPLGLRELQS